MSSRALASLRSAVEKPSVSLSYASLSNFRAHQARPSVAAIRPPNQTLVHERTQSFDNVELVQALDPARHVFDRLERRAGEHREQLEEPPLGRVEHLVTPVDRVAQRLLPEGRIAGSTT